MTTAVVKKRKIDSKKGIKQGQFYIDKTDNSIYIVARLYNGKYSLIDIATGDSYHEPVKYIIDIFYDDENDFTLIEDNSIIKIDIKY